MTLQNTTRIDVAIKPKSRLRLVMYISLSGITIGLGWLASLALWQYITVLIISMAVIGYLLLSRPIPLHLSQPTLNQRIDHQWQLLVHTGRGDELWLANLCKVHRYQWALIIVFDVVEPYQKPFSVTIFRDQVNDEQWVKLNILANVSASKLR
ncbi:hypothetical protein [Psychrobacter sp.]|uniref:hypothetical protein n=1 Tax=Psychrobacter sp. TaxID=56811 RepID=UPI002649A087|nr:hypothetical protein [Psychrobacter sp.]MDN6275520.1 hypothetical protein [Psychrobacter sp.]MDN6307873.1 hypothetical protein [Psychrobacter sp.]